MAIVGGGPAGMSAAYYLARLGYPVTVFEAMPVPGGMMAIGIPEYRLPREALKAEIDRILALGVELRLDSAMGRDYSLGDLEAQGYRAIFLATGASRSRRLGVPGDGLDGVVPATLFLKQVNLGEAPRLSGAVVVVGGGSTAMDASRSAIRSGASSVTVLYRRGRDDMPAQPEEIEAAEREGVVIRDVSAVVEVLGDRHITGVRVQRQQATGERSGGRVLYGGVEGSDEVLAGDQHPRRGRRRARPVHPARGSRHRGQRLRRHRRRSPHPGHRPCRSLCRWRRRVGAQDHHRRGGCRSARGGIRPRVPRRRRSTARRTSWPSSATGHRPTGS